MKAARRFIPSRGFEPHTLRSRQPVAGPTLAEQRQPERQADYRATRAKVEPKLGHLLRRKHGGRRARVRGKDKIAADFDLLAAAVSIARLTALGLRSTGTGWAAATA